MANLPISPSSRQDALAQPEISVAFEAFSAASKIVKANGNETLRLALARAIVLRALEGERDTAALCEHALKAVAGRDG